MRDADRESLWVTEEDQQAFKEAFQAGLTHDTSPQDRDWKRAPIETFLATLRDWIIPAQEESHLRAAKALGMEGVGGHIGWREKPARIVAISANPWKRLGFYASDPLARLQHSLISGLISYGAFMLAGPVVWAVAVLFGALCLFFLWVGTWGTRGDWKNAISSFKEVFSPDAYRRKVVVGRSSIWSNPDQIYFDPGKEFRFEGLELSEITSVDQDGAFTVSLRTPLAGKDGVSEEPISWKVARLSEVPPFPWTVRLCCLSKGA